MNTKGFTLIEVVLAMAIFALASLAALSAASGHLRSVGELENRTFATMVAANRMAEMHYERRWPPVNDAQGEVELAGKQWHWQQQVTQTVTDDLQEVTIIVRLDPDGPEEARLSSFVGRR